MLHARHAARADCADAGAPLACGAEVCMWALYSITVVVWGVSWHAMLYAGRRRAGLGDRDPGADVDVAAHRHDPLREESRSGRRPAARSARPRAAASAGSCPGTRRGRCSSARPSATEYSRIASFASTSTTQPSSCFAATRRSPLSSASTIAARARASQRPLEQRDRPAHPPRRARARRGSTLAGRTEVRPGRRGRRVRAALRERLRRPLGHPPPRGTSSPRCRRRGSRCARTAAGGGRACGRSGRVRRRAPRRPRRPPTRAGRTPAARCRRSAGTPSTPRSASGHRPRSRCGTRSSSCASRAC